jgi:threonine dehydratase
MLAQMRRMATIGAMYAKAPVFLDPALGGAAATSGNAGAGSCFAAASAAAEATLPLPGTFAKVEVDPEEEQA